MASRDAWHARSFMHAAALSPQPVQSCIGVRLRLLLQMLCLIERLAGLPSLQAGVPILEQQVGQHSKEDVNAFPPMIVSADMRWGGCNGSLLMSRQRVMHGRQSARMPGCLQELWGRRRPSGLTS